MTQQFVLFQTWRSPAQMAPHWHQANFLSSSPRRRRRSSSRRLYAATVTTACMEPLQRTDDLTKQLLEDVAAQRASQSGQVSQKERIARLESALTHRRRERLRIRAKRPIWTYILIAMNCSVVIAQKLTSIVCRVLSVQTTTPNLQSLGAKVSTKIMCGQLWRLLTPAFLHVNMRHLLLNMYALYALGSATEILYGSAAFLSIYIGGAIGGNVASLCASVYSSRASVGSSGAVFGLIAAMLVHLDRNRAPIGPVARENLRMVGTATLINLMGGWVMPSVDGWAHFGGFVFGIVMALRLAPQVVLHRSMDTGRITFVEVRRAGRRISAITGATAVVMSVVMAVGLRISLLL